MRVRNFRVALLAALMLLLAVVARGAMPLDAALVPAEACVETSDLLVSTPSVVLLVHVEVCNRGSFDIVVHRRWVERTILSVYNRILSRTSCGTQWPWREAVRVPTDLAPNPLVDFRTTVFFTPVGRRS